MSEESEEHVVLHRVVIERRLSGDGDVVSVETEDVSGEELTQFDALALLARAQFFVMGV